MLYKGTFWVENRSVNRVDGCALSVIWTGSCQMNEKV